MPRLTQPTRKRRNLATLDENQTAFLLEGRCDYFNLLRNHVGRWRELWEFHRDELLAEWLTDNPGTRPYSWWKFDAPELRQCITGPHPFDDPARIAFVELLASNSPNPDAVRHTAKLTRWGMPCVWHVGFKKSYEFESETEYLVRLHLLTPGESLALGDDEADQ